jgi:hypothetical protein
VAVKVGSNEPMEVWWYANNPAYSDSRCAPLWSTWSCPRGLRGWPRRRGHKPGPPAAPPWEGSLGRRVPHGAAPPLLRPGARPLVHPPAALPSLSAPALHPQLGPHPSHTYSGHAQLRHRAPAPQGPLPGQKKPPCDPRTEEEIRGVCWGVLRADPPCSSAYEYEGRCYLPLFTDPPQPTSGAP